MIVHRGFQQHPVDPCPTARHTPTTVARCERKG